jgi:8-oxo-dGTP pyrophosphatase MutT (NUDIX family)
MTVSNGVIAETLNRYLAANPEQRDNVLRLLDALESDSADLWSRSTMPVHVTCSTAVINDGKQVLMIHHRALGKWLLPGGHIEEVDASLLQAALRELEEETGIPWQSTTRPPAMDVIPVDVDVHLIPANPAKGEGEHWHADFRFAFSAPTAEVQLQLEEVVDYGWRPLSDLQTERLATRVARYAAA